MRCPYGIIVLKSELIFIEFLQVVEFFFYVYGALCICSIYLGVTAVSILL